ncbi:hypothetical protein [Paenibacillus humicus]|uniref:hypothetical protein n=1 Tax=Paenibacillus humicus TaxID=412861 RepID=UPI003D2E7860
MLAVVVNTASTVEPSPGEDHRIPWDVACPGRGLLAEASGSRQSLRQDCCESASSLAVTEAGLLANSPSPPGLEAATPLGL